MEFTKMELILALETIENQIMPGTFKDIDCTAEILWSTLEAIKKTQDIETNIDDNYDLILGV